MTSWWWALLVWAVCALVTFGAMRLLGTWNHRQTVAGPAHDQLAPTGVATVLVVTVLVWITAGTWIARTTRRVDATVLGSVAWLLLLGCLSGYASLGGLRTSTGARMEDRDGRIWFATESRFIDIENTLGVVHACGALSETIVVEAVGEFGPADAGHVLVPVDAELPINEAFLVAQPGGGVALIWHEPDRTTGALLARGPDGSPCLADPFVLFSPGDRGDPSSAESWRAAFADPSRALADDDYDRHLTAALDHPCEWVRETARSWVQAGGERRFPTATRQLGR